MVHKASLGIRLWLRVVSAVMLLLIAVLMASSARHYFSARTVTLANCATEIKASSRLLCHLGNEVLMLLPASARGWVEGLLHLGLAAGLIYFAWRMIRPLVSRTPPAS